MPFIPDPNDPNNPRDPGPGLNDPMPPDEERAALPGSDAGNSPSSPPADSGFAGDPNNPGPDIQPGGGSSDGSGVLVPGLGSSPQGLVDQPQPPSPPDPMQGFITNRQSGSDLTRGYGGGGGSGTLNLGDPAEGPGAYTESGANVDPTLWEVDPNQLTSYQMEKLMENGNPLLEMTRERARRAHLAGGGQNSAMATQAGELAVVQEAFRIGSADAAVFAKSAEFNAAVSNQFGLAEQSFIHQSLMSDQNFKQSQVIQKERIQDEFAAQYGLSAQAHDQFFERIGAAFDLDVEKMRVGQFLADRQAQRDFTRTWQLNASQNWVNYFNNNQQAVAEIGSNPNLSPEQANAAMREMAEMGRQGLSVMEGFYTGGMQWANPGGAAGSGPPPNYAMYFTPPWWMVPSQGGGG